MGAGERVGRGAVVLFDIRPGPVFKASPRHNRTAAGPTGDRLVVAAGKILPPTDRTALTASRNRLVTVNRDCLVVKLRCRKSDRIQFIFSVFPDQKFLGVSLKDGGQKILNPDVSFFHLIIR